MDLLVRWGFVGKYKVQWTMVKVQNSARFARMQTPCH